MRIVLSEKIELLQKSGYTQSQLARIIGCGPSMISMMKSGYSPNNQRLEKRIDELYKHTKP